MQKMQFILFSLIILMCGYPRLRTIYGYNEVHYAVYVGNIDNVKQECRKKPALINEKDSEGKTPLDLAIIFNQPEIALWLIENGAIIKIRKNYCCWNSPEFLGKKGVIYDAKPIHIASYKGNNVIIKKLIENGEKINSEIKISPLVFAVAGGKQDTVDYLINLGYSVNSKDVDVNPLVAAVKMKDKFMIVFLMSKGAEINNYDKAG
ncbi:MAG: ankyrin repeat domain-containing protein, partial [Firmicutes bacterium]|nr:ankyrin repeat domain-containing protein [Bacillota bacterium]